MKKIFLFLAVISLCMACNPYRKITYIRGVGEKVKLEKDPEKFGVPDPVIKIGDLLIIIVNHDKSPEAVAHLALPWMPAQGLAYRPSGALSAGGGGLQSYHVDTEGYIIFPGLGKIHIAGMTKSELNQYLVKEVRKFLTDKDKDPIITIRFSNFKITIISDEGRSGNFSIDNEKVNIFEAIGYAGGLSLHARRDNVLLIRETETGRKTYRIDLRDKKLLESPYYWLEQNDILYFQSDKQAARSTYFGQLENMALGITGTLMSVASFTISMINYITNSK